MKVARALHLAFLSVSAEVLFEGPVLAAQLTWEAPAGCPDRDAVRWRVEDAIGVPLEKAAALSFAAKVEQRVNKRWRVVLDVTSESDASEPQHREFEADACDDLVKAASVAIALALGAGDVDKGSATASRTNEAPADAPRRAEPAASASPALIRADATQKKPEYRVAAQLGAFLDYQSLPGISPGIQISAIGSWRALGVKLGGVALPESTTRTTSGPGGSFTLLAGSAGLCGLVGRVPGELRLCAGSELGNMSGKAVNATTSRKGSAVWVAPFVELNGSSSLADSIRFFVSVAALVPLIRKEFYVEGVPEATHQPGILAGRLGVGLEILWQ